MGWWRSLIQKTRSRRAQLESTGKNGWGRNRTTAEKRQADGRPRPIPARRASEPGAPAECSASLRLAFNKQKPLQFLNAKARSCRL